MAVVTPAVVPVVVRINRAFAARTMQQAFIQSARLPIGYPMQHPDPDAVAPDAALIEALALTAIEALPEAFRVAAQAIALRVAEFPADDMLEQFGIEDAFDLTGLYDGVPLTERSVTDQPDRPDAIWLFRRPILDEWAERGNVTLAELVSHVLIHELAHHFGWSDDDIAAIDAWWE